MTGNEIMTDEKKIEATEIADEALEDAQGAGDYLKFQLKDAMVSKISTLGSGGHKVVEEEEEVQMMKADFASLKAPTAASDVEKAGVLRRRPTR